MRTELALSGRRIIGFAGRWVWEKGFDMVLEALPSLLRTHPDVQLVFAGMQPHYENFLDRCRPAIERVGDRLTSVHNTLLIRASDFLAIRHRNR